MRDSAQKPAEPTAKIEPDVVPAPDKPSETQEQQVNLIRNPSELVVNVDDESER